MKLSHLAMAAALAALSSTSSVWAQSGGSKSAPAEFPPAGFKGMQYVDSRGCVYIRAGVDGNVSWIPRLTRKRKHICGMTPTQVAGTTSAPSTQRNKVVQITLEPETVPERVAEAAPKKVLTPTTRSATPTRVAAAPAKPKTQEVVQVAKPVATAAVTPTAVKVATPRPARKPNALAGLFKRKPAVKAAPVRSQPIELVPETQPAVTVPTRRVATTAPARTVPVRVITPSAAPAAAVPVPVQQSVQATCANRSAASRPYIKSTSKYPFRCGPQSGGGFAPATANTRTIPESGATRVASSVAVRGTAVPSTSLPGSTRVVPLHVANARAGVGAFTVPDGFRPAWEDDRLNPHRAEGTLAGRDTMNLRWTTTVPRRLIVAGTGQDVTAKVALVYPFTDLESQRRSLGEVTLITRNGQTLKRVVRKAGAPSAAELARTKPAVKSVVATRSAEPKKPIAKVQGERIQGKRYVQVGTFGVQGNAQATANRMKRIGMPVRIGKFSKSGQTMRMVLAGPFADTKTAERALRAVRKAGFKDAFLRK